MTPFDAAAASVWQLAQGGFVPLRKSCLPATGSPAVALMCATAPQPASTNARPPTSSTVSQRLIERSGSGQAQGRATHSDPSRARRRALHGGTCESSGNQGSYRLLFEGAWDDLSLARCLRARAGNGHPPAALSALISARAVGASESDGASFKNFL